MHLADESCSRAGLVAGAVNAVAGGGSLITFPALLGTGYGQVAANVTNSVAVSPGYVASVLRHPPDLRDLAASRRAQKLINLIPAAIIGTAVGCTLLLATPGGGVRGRGAVSRLLAPPSARRPAAAGKAGRAAA